MCPSGIRILGGLSLNSIFIEHLVHMSITPAGNPLRPVWWGVFISLGLFLALLLAQSMWKSHLESAWQNLKVAKEQDLRDFVQARLDERTYRPTSVRPSGGWRVSTPRKI
jgi:hypothetical protein